MKQLFVLAVFVVFCCGNEISTVPGDNSHYVEGESRYIWMPNGEGVPQLVDLQAPVEENILNFRNGANNQYWLYTRQNPLDYQIITYGNASTLWASNYNSNQPVKVIIHGWYGSGNSKMVPLITNAFLAVQDCNIIVVDWSAVAGTNYATAVAAVPNVGEHVGNFMIWLINTSGGNWTDVHLVGFSLGAHVVGSAGRTASGWPARVTGLDPAGPGWIFNKNALDVNAGQYVEAIHTCGGLLGLFNPIADADFYPNGGKSPQPGCWSSSCSHHRATELFAAAVYQNHLVGRRCGNIWEADSASCNGEEMHMGSAIISKSGKGIYGLKTGNMWPFNLL